MVYGYKPQTDCFLTIATLRNVFERKWQREILSKTEVQTEAGDMRLRFARLSEHATAPTKGSARAAGYDLYR